MSRRKAPARSSRRGVRPRRTTAWCELHGGCGEEAAAYFQGVTIDNQPVTLWGCAPHADAFEGRERHAPFVRRPSPFLDAAPPPA